MRVVVPFATREPKTRLGSVLDATEREAFARTMLADVLGALQETRADLAPEVLATAPVDVDVPVTVDERPLTAAVNGVIEAGTPVAIVMADLALATPDALDRLVEASGDLAIVPGRGGGTNALVVREPDFRVDYHGVSYRDHRERARAVDATVEPVDSHRLSTDVDEAADLVEVLLHAEGSAPEWLRDRGFELAVTDGRVGVRRTTDDEP